MRLSVLSFLWFLPCCVLATVFDLSSLHWTLTNQNGSISVPGSVPSQVHLDLVRTGIITEPLLGINGRLFHEERVSILLKGIHPTDFTQRWVWMDNWTYTADLTPAFSELKNSDQVLLVFHGLDTIANIVSVSHFSHYIQFLIASLDSRWEACSLGEQPIPPICVRRLLAAERKVPREPHCRV
jgi:beta-mannosidase